MIYTKAQKEKDFWAFISCQIRAKRFMCTQFESLDGMRVMRLDTDINVHKMLPILNELDIPYVREDWEGNKSCDSDWDIIYFYHKGYKFWELTEKEENNERQ